MSRKFCDCSPKLGVLQSACSTWQLGRSLSVSVDDKMAKTKKKKQLTEKMAKARRQKSSKSAVNPFEVKVNRQKHQVLNRKLTRHDKGTPGVSRSKAIKRVSVRHPSVS